MFKRFIPFAHAKNIYEIPVDFFTNLNVKYLFTDLDNTLDSYRLYKPLPKAVEYINSLRENGIEPVIISNNKGKRVSSYANELKVRYIPFSKKPSGKAIRNFMKDNNIEKNEVMFIGDQMLTDVWAAYNAGIRMILTDKLVKEDQFTTRFNRIFDRLMRKYHNRRGNIKDWREYYGKTN